MAWTTAAAPHRVNLPAAPGEFAITSFDGKLMPPVTATRAGLSIELSDGPAYIVPASRDAAWEKAVLAGK